VTIKIRRKTIKGKSEAGDTYREVLRRRVDLFISLHRVFRIRNNRAQRRNFELHGQVLLPFYRRIHYLFTEQELSHEKNLVFELLVLSATFLTPLSLLASNIEKDILRCRHISGLQTIDRQTWNLMTWRVFHIDFTRRFWRKKKFHDRHFWILLDVSNSGDSRSDE